MIAEEKLNWLRQIGVLPATAEKGAPETAAPVAPVAAKPDEGHFGLSVKAPADDGTPPGLTFPEQGGNAPEALQESLTIPGLPIPIPIPGINDVKILVTVTLDNQTSHALELDKGSAQLEHDVLADFDTKPPPHIAKGRSGKMVISSFVGAGGQVAYNIADDPAKTKVWMKWDRGRIPKREHFEEVWPPSPDKWEFNGGFTDDDFTFTLTELGAPGPGPGPGPAAGVNATCMITVTNNTKSVLTLAHQGHDVGDFMTFPAASVPAGGSTSFVSVQTPNEKDATQGCKGFAVFDVGEPAVGVWRVEWNNPKTEKNTASATIDPASAGFRSLEQAGQGDENVPMVFTLSGGPEPGPKPDQPKPDQPKPDQPKPDQPKPEGPEPDFKPPPESKQPTLRVGDKSPDGWVEYMQYLLKKAMDRPGLKVDGAFGPATQKAVVEFQMTRGLMADGIVGNQTWAALREGAPEAPSTDGRKAHSFEDKGPSARWTKENSVMIYSEKEDCLKLVADSPGEQPADDFGATVKIMPPGGKAHVVQLKLGKPVFFSNNKEDKVHVMRIEKFRATYPSADPKAPATEYEIDAYLDAALGGDRFTGKVVLE